jgi:hypothetical protein
MDPVGVAAQDLAVFELGNVPEYDGFVFAAGGEDMGAGFELDGLDALGVAAELAKAFARMQVPDLALSLVAARC